MDDEVVSGVWQLDPDTRLDLRLQRVKSAIGDADWPRVVMEAEELLDEAPEHIETLGLLATALLELGDAESAAEAFEDYLGRAGPDAVILSGLALARFESCDLMGAIEAAREAIRRDGSLAEAHYTLAMALERMGDASEAAQSFALAHMMDEVAFPLPLQLTDADLQLAVSAALSALPPPIRDFWAGIPLQVEEEPALTELTAATPPLPPTIAGMYDGVPPNDDTVHTARPLALRLFRRNLARCGTLDEVTQQLALVLQQEALDWLGVPFEDPMGAS